MLSFFILLIFTIVFIAMFFGGIALIVTGIYDIMDYSYDMTYYSYGIMKYPYKVGKHLIFIIKIVVGLFLIIGILTFSFSQTGSNLLNYEIMQKCRDNDAVCYYIEDKYTDENKNVMVLTDVDSKKEKIVVFCSEILNYKIKDENYIGVDSKLKLKDGILLDVTDVKLIMKGW